MKDDTLRPVEREPYSHEFIAARQRGWDAQNAVGALLMRQQQGDDSVARSDIEAAEQEAVRLAAEAFAVLEADRERRALSLRQEQEAQVLAAPFDAAVERVARVLRERGPLTASEIEALRLPALSKNSVRPTLREAQGRGLVRRERSGRRVLWIAEA